MPIIIQELLLLAVFLAGLRIAWLIGTSAVKFFRRLEII